VSRVLCIPRRRTSEEPEGTAFWVRRVLGAFRKGLRSSCELALPTAVGVAQTTIRPDRSAVSAFRAPNHPRPGGYDGYSDFLAECIGKNC